MRNLSRLSVCVAALWTLAVGVAAAQEREAVLQEITLRGTVEAVDHTARIVRIRGDQGGVVTLDVPASYTRFDQVKVGDVVTMGYYDRVNIRLKPAGEAAVDRKVEPTTTPAPGIVPGGTMASQRITTVTIDSWDPATRMVGFSTPTGQRYNRRVNETIEPAVISGLKVGDRVDVTRTEAIRLTVETPAPVQPAVVPDEDSFRHRLTLSFLWGPDNQFSGKVITAGSGLFQDTVPLSFNETSYDDLYGRMGLFKIGVGYRTSPRSEAVVNLVFSRSSADVITVGTVGDQNAPLSADLDDYAYWGIEGGQRFYFSRVRFTPFVGYIVGINRFTHIDGNFFAPAVGTQPELTISDGRMFDSSWAFSVGPTGGILIGVGPIEVMAEVAFRFMGGLSDVDFLVQADLRDINAESSRWSLPILFGARVRF